MNEVDQTEEASVAVQVFAGGEIRISLRATDEVVYQKSLELANSIRDLLGPISQRLSAGGND